jgi:hypothetical protein
VGQDWGTSYRGRDGVLHRFLLMSSLQLRVCDPLSIQLLEESATKVIGYQSITGESISSAEPGTDVVIVGSNLGSSGSVVFQNNIGGLKLAADPPSKWTDTAITVRVPTPWPPEYPPFPWAGPVIVKRSGCRRAEGPEFTITPPASRPQRGRGTATERAARTEEPSGPPEQAD